MTKSIRTALIFAFVAAAILSAVFPSANATSYSFILEPESCDVVDDGISLGVSDEIHGSIQANSTIDVVIVSPSGTTLRYDGLVTNATFDMIASENGTYSLAVSNENPYFVEGTIMFSLAHFFTVSSAITFNMGFDATTSSTTTIIPPPPDDRTPEMRNPLEPFVNFRKATEILSILQRKTSMPVRYFMVTAFALSTLMFLSIFRQKHYVLRNGTFRTLSRKLRTIVF